MEMPDFFGDFGDSGEVGEIETSPEDGDGKRVFKIRLGNFRGTSNGVEGESSSSHLGGRRCFSMGSFQYVVAPDSHVQVEFSVAGSDGEGKRITGRSRGESLSVSKIWLWNKKGQLPVSAAADQSD